MQLHLAVRGGDVLHHAQAALPAPGFDLDRFAHQRILPYVTTAAPSTGKAAATPAASSHQAKRAVGHHTAARTRRHAAGAGATCTGSSLACVAQGGKARATHKHARVDLRNTHDIQKHGQDKNKTQIYNRQAGLTLNGVAFSIQSTYLRPHEVAGEDEGLVDVGHLAADAVQVRVAGRGHRDEVACKKGGGRKQTNMP